MKILLFNEFSGLHHNLSEGLKELGHTVVVASSGDNWKEFPMDISLHPNKKTKVGRFLYRLNLINKLTGFDIIQIVGGVTFYGYKTLDNAIIKYLLNNNSKSFYLAAGCDSEFLLASDKFLKKASPCPQCIKEDSLDNKCTIKLYSDYFTSNNDAITKKVNKLFPI